MTGLDRSDAEDRKKGSGGGGSMNVGCLVFAFAATALSMQAAAETPRRVLADPAAMIENAQRMDFVGKNSFAREASEFGQVLRSTPQRSASGLYLGVNVGSSSLGAVTWRWRVDRLQFSADIRDLSKEDCGATIFFIFGRPSLSNKDVATLAYTWTATPVSNGTVLRSLRYKNLRYIQLRGRSDVGAWRRERRNLASDFRMIFGRAAPPLQFVAIFNDNDQTAEPMSALFGVIEWDH